MEACRTLTLRIALAAAVLLGAAAPSFAATHYVTPVSPYTWLESLNPATPTTLAVANANAAAGDVVQLYAGEYPITIAPANSGSPLAGWIRFVGSLSNPALVSMPAGLSINSKNRISVAGVRFRDDTVFERANTCSLSFCLVDSGGWVSHAVNSDAAALGISESLHVYSVVFRQDQSGDSKFAQKLRKTRHSTFERCQFYKNITPATFEHRGRFLYFSHNNTWTDCRMDVEPWGIAPNEQFAIGIRDSSELNVFIRDTVRVGMTSRQARAALLSHSGSWPGKTRNNVWDSCDYRSFGGLTNGQGAFSIQDSAYGLTIRNSVFASADTVALFLYGSVTYDGLDLTHNTFLSRGRSIFASDANAVTNSRFRGNAFITTRATGCGKGWLPFSLKFAASLAGNDSNAVVTPDTSQVYRASSCYTPRGYVIATGRDARTSFTLNASLAVEDTTWATLDLRPKAGGPLISSAFPGGYAGAFAPAAADTCEDADRPGTVADLTMSAAPGEYGFFGWAVSPGETQFTGSGDETEIHVRRAAAPILSIAQWDAATEVLTEVVSTYAAPGEPASGNLIDFPPSSGTYWFAVRFKNASNGKWSCLSNTDSAYITVPDLTPPAAISNLVVTSSGNGLARLTWTAPTDAGGVRSYAVRMRMGPISASTFDDTLRGGSGVQGRTYRVAYPVAEVPVPGSPGAAEAMTFALRQGATYWFAIKSTDAAGNVSDVSNVDSVTVRVGSDLMGFPRRDLYGGAGPVGAATSKAWPYLYYDSLTTNRRELDKIARFSVICVNPNAAAGDSFVAVVAYLRWRNPNIRILIEDGPDVAYYQGALAAVGTGPKFRREFDYYRRVWLALNRITPWPSSFTMPYLTGYGTPQGYGGSPDTTSKSAWLFSRNPGRKNAMWGTLVLDCPCEATSGVHANAGATLRNVNVAYRNSLGQLEVADTLVRIRKELFYDRYYVGYDGVTRHLVDGFGSDLNSHYAAQNNTFQITRTDSVDWLRAGYTNRPGFNGGWTESKLYMDRRSAELMPDWEIFGGNGFNAGSYDYASGFKHEYLPGQQGGSWFTNIEWAPGGGIFDAWVYGRRPSYHTWMRTFTGEFSDTSAVVGFDPNDAQVRKEFRIGITTACIVGAYFSMGTTRASAAHGQTHAKGAYYSWPFDEDNVDVVTARSYADTNVAIAAWLGNATTPPYYHYPSAAGAIFKSTLSNAGATAPDSSIWQSLQKDARGRVTVRPGGPPGFPYCLELRPAAVYGADWQVGAISKTFAVTNQDYTISGWVKADTARFVTVGFRDSATAGAWGGSGGMGRKLLATPEWRPFAFKVFAGGSSANVGLAVYGADTLQSVKFTGWQIHAGDSVLMIREFENGVAIANPSTSGTKGHTFGRLTRRIIARPGVTQDVNNGSLSRSVSVPASDGLLLPWAVDSLRPATPTIVAGVTGRTWAQISIPSAVGDDSLSGAVQTIEVRVRTDGVAVSDANWGTSTAVAASFPLVNGGQPQTVTLNGLATNTAYRVGIRAQDEAGWTSPTSNSVTLTTTSSAALAVHEGK